MGDWTKDTLDAVADRILEAAHFKLMDDATLREVQEFRRRFILKLRDSRLAIERAEILAANCNEQGRNWHLGAYD